MVDWWSVFTNGMWLFALALFVATVSMAHYQAGEQRVKMRSVLARPPYDAVLTIGGVLFFSGLAAVDDRLWATIVFAVMALATAALFLYYRRQSPAD